MDVCEEPKMKGEESWGFRVWIPTMEEDHMVFAQALLWVVIVAKRGRKTHCMWFYNMDLVYTPSFQKKIFRRNLLNFHTLVRNVSFPSLTNTRSHNLPLLGSSVLVSTRVSASNTIYNSLSPSLVDIFCFGMLYMSPSASQF